MKRMLAIAGFIFSVSAQAAIVGDYAVFTYNYTNEKGPSVGWSSREILSHVGDTYTLTEQFHLEGYTPTVHEKAYDKSEIMTDELVHTWLDHCEYNNGVYETIVVPAGRFETCKTALKNADGEVHGWLWIGNVPLGVVKHSQTNADGTSFDLEMSAFSWGIR